jgi:voltage-gated potassium channel
VKVPRQLLVVLGLIALLLLVGTVGFRLTEGWTWFESFYCVLMTVSTIGASPENSLSHAGREFNVFLVFLGLAVVGFAVTGLAHAVIESELGSVVSRWRMEKEIAKLKDHFIICGIGRVGRRVAEEIAALHMPLVIVERDSERVQWARDHEFPYIIGDATREDTLRKARIEHAQGLASAVTTDAQNVYIILTARGMVPNLPIVTRASEEGSESKLMKAGATTVISPYSYAGLRMARMLTRPNVQRFIDTALSSLSDTGQDLGIDEVCVTEKSKLIGSALEHNEVRRRLGVIVLAIRRKQGGLEFNPGPEQTVNAGDCLIALGDPKDLKKLESLAGA